MKNMQNCNIYLVLATEGTEIESFENAFESYDDAKKFIYEDMKRREIEEDKMKAHFEYDYEIKKIELLKRVNLNAQYQVNLADEEIGTFECKHKAMQAIKKHVIERGFSDDDFEDYLEDYEVKVIEHS